MSSPIRQARRKDLLLRRIVDNSFDAIVTFDRSLRMLSCNRAAETMFACPAREARGISLDWLLPEVAENPAAELVGTSPRQQLARRRSGVCLPVEVAFGATELDGDWIGIAAVRDIGVALYDPDADTNSVRRLTLRGELRRAIDERQLELYFQPKVAAASERLAGVEALVRWRHPRLGLISPDEFVPFAEQAGLIGPMTDALLDQALERQRAWRRAGFDIAVAVNLSVRSLQNRALAEQLRDRLGRYGASAERLQLEITESALMADPDCALEVLGELAALGCKLALDDFGTGYSSLAYLQKLPIDELKIDRSFVVSMADDPSAVVIVRATIGLAHGLGLGVVAEGVEDLTVFEALRGLGCDQLQGHLFGRPMPDQAFRRWLLTSHWRPQRDPDQVAPDPERRTA